MEFELLQWGDGSIRLSYEDHLHGHDRVFVLKADSTTWESDRGEAEILTQVNLVAILRAMISREEVIA